MILYLDSSAITKLVVDEAETGALRSHVAEATRRPATSVLTRVEVTRAVARAADTAGNGNPFAQAATTAARVLDWADAVPVSADVVRTASLLRPVTLRTLDAIHVASALLLPEPPLVVTYDVRMAAACRAAGLEVSAPS